MTATVEKEVKNKVVTTPAMTVGTDNIGAKEGLEVKSVKVKGRVSPLSTPQTDMSAKKPFIVEFPVPKEQIAKMEIPNPDKRKKADIVYHLYVPLSNWLGRKISDSINPRSHEQNTLRSPVAKKIEETILEKPENFHLANLGITILAESLKYNEKTETCQIIITNSALQGIANGGHTDMIINKVQNQLARQIAEKRDISYEDFLKEISDISKIPDNLKNALVHIEVFVGLEDIDRISDLVEGRNTNRQLKAWSLADFRSEFDWLKDILEAPSSEFRDKIGYEENSNKKVTILDIAGLITLFHEQWDSKEVKDDKADSPVVAYSSRGRLDQRLTSPTFAEGYKKLANIIPDIIRLHDYVYSSFPKHYENSRPKSRLARRQGVKNYSTETPPYKSLPLTGAHAEYKIPAGLIYPLLSAFRALVVYKDGKAYWKKSPFDFNDKHGASLVGELISNLDEEGGNPSVLGKRARVYKAMFNHALILQNEDEKNSK